MLYILLNQQSSESFSKINKAEFKIEEIPGSIINLNNLRKLDLRGNKITTVPEVLLDLPNLERLDLRWIV